MTPTTTAAIPMTAAIPTTAAIPMTPVIPAMAPAIPFLTRSLDPDIRNREAPILGLAPQGLPKPWNDPPRRVVPFSFKRG
jgi:hypothetical protein